MGFTTATWEAASSPKRANLLFAYERVVVNLRVPLSHAHVSDRVVERALAVRRRDDGQDRRRLRRDRIVTDHAPDLFYQVILHRDVFGCSPGGDGDQEDAWARLRDAELEPLQDVVGLLGELLRDPACG